MKYCRCDTYRAVLKRCRRRKELYLFVGRKSNDDAGKFFNSLHTIIHLNVAIFLMLRARDDDRCNRKNFVTLQLSLPKRLQKFDFFFLSLYHLTFDGELDEKEKDKCTPGPPSALLVLLIGHNHGCTPA